MTNQQIAKQLKDKGFKTQIIDFGHPFVFVSLDNRKINMIEVESALDFDVPSESMHSDQRGIAVFGFDS